jgi:hypothetical protein
MEDYFEGIIAARAIKKDLMKALRGKSMLSLETREDLGDDSIGNVGGE